MTYHWFGRRNITIIASIFLFAGVLFGWAGVASLQKKNSDEATASGSPQDAQVFIVNADGTGLHQATPRRPKAF